MEQLSLPARHKAQGTITLPGSKSISNRTLLLAALASGVTEIRDLLASDDTSRMLEALQTLGVKLENFAENAWRVTGCNGNFPNKNAEIFLGNAGTAFRPLTAALALAGGDYTLSGVPRMHERPIGDLVDALKQAGSEVHYLANNGFPPLKLYPPKIDLSKPIKIRGDVSSQFLTALLMALPLTKQKATIEVVGELISKPYIEITLNLMAKFGIDVVRDGWERFTIPENCSYKSPGIFFVEGDASSASYFLAAGAISGGPVRVIGISKDSIQGDVKFTGPLGQPVYTTAPLSYMNAIISWGDNWIESRAPVGGKLLPLNIDCNHIPDAAMTLAIVALFAEGTSTLRNIASWRVKETDRIAAMATELRKVGAIVEEGADYIKITPPAQLTPNAVIDTYDDHRMAMCFSLVSLGGVPITINDPACVNKTFPNYFKEFKNIAIS
ncbi:MAG: 3-phosphoshikimate 1-carboxyvinyltransferase [Methylotenera sp.]|uniref:3-phosphoshikimate 1-carboxyvinyltransferase n=1 Tax=Methylotenera sp. TaxID=2051956 RepID=UPI002488B6CC|nr:3-phosphoshikimate 1-carboxyvinyltransferase [Methylotenera sp.]MDI1308591.1 3-phosphoshikimate 1-carboxyvinyltransferase [Methylotenera sp.]